MKHLWAIAFLIGSLASAGEALAFDLTAGGGVRRIIKDDLVRAEEGEGREWTLRGHAWPGAQEFLALGVTASARSFQLDVGGGDAAATTDAKVSGDGTYKGRMAGPQLEVSLPFWGMRPYVRTAYLAGTYHYDAESTTTTKENATSYKTDVSTGLTLEARGLEAGLGVRFFEPFGFFVEYGESYETLEVTGVSFSFVNTVGGEEEPLDSSRDQYEESLGELVGKRYGHASRLIVLGTFWQI